MKGTCLTNVTFIDKTSPFVQCPAVSPIPISPTTCQGKTYLFSGSKNSSISKLDQYHDCH